MDVVEFRSLLIESLKDNSIKSELLKLLSDDNVSEQLKAYEDKIKELESSIEASDKKYKDLLSDYNDMTGTSSAVKLESENKDKKIAELTKALDDLKSGESDAEKISADRIARLTAEVDELRSAASSSVVSSGMLSSFGPVIYLYAAIDPILIATARITAMITLTFVFIGFPPLK